MAIGLMHNLDISPILMRKKGLALIHYICNYATKLNAPRWKRLALAAELSDLARQTWHVSTRKELPAWKQPPRWQVKQNRFCCESRTEYSRAESFRSLKCLATYSASPRIS